jgi:hypothetical protein
MHKRTEDVTYDCYKTVNKMMNFESSAVRHFVVNFGNQVRTICARYARDRILQCSRKLADTQVNYSTKTKRCFVLLVPLNWC